MLCAIWCHLYNLKNVENTYGGVLLLVPFSKFTNGNKSRKASNIKSKLTELHMSSNKKKTIMKDILGSWLSCLKVTFIAVFEDEPK